DEPVLDDRSDRLRTGPQLRPRVDGPLGDHRVEIPAPHDVAVGREDRMVGPGELERDAVRDRAEAVEALVSREPVLQPHVVELPHRARREAVAARLLAREALAFDREHASPAAREPVRRGGTRGSGADDEHVVPLAHVPRSRAYGAGRSGPASAPLTLRSLMFPALAPTARAARAPLPLRSRSARSRGNRRTRARASLLRVALRGARRGAPKRSTAMCRAPIYRVMKRGACRVRAGEPGDVSARCPT